MDTQKVNKWLKIIKSSSTNKKAALEAILNDCTYDELEMLYQKVPSLYKGLLSLSYLKRANYSQVYNTSIQPRREVKDYIGVLVYVIKRNAVLLNRYVAKKRKVDKAVLNGDYNKARELIKEVNQTISASYWAAVYEIKLERLQNGLAECTNLYNRMFRENQTVVQYIYYCAYRSSSLEFLLDDVKRVLLSGNQPYEEFLNNYLISHCMPYLGFQEGEWICTDMNSSIIDLYNNLINFLPNLSKNTLGDPLVKRYLKELNSIIDDIYVRRLCYLFGIADTPVEDSDRNAIIDSYYRGDYCEVQQTAQSYLQENIDDFEIHDIYLRTIVLRGGRIDQPGNNCSLVDKIRYYYSEILSHRTNTAFYKRRLISLCRSQYHITGLRYLYCLLEGIETYDIYGIYNTIWKYGYYNSPLEACYFSEQSSKKNYIHKLTNGNAFWTDLFNENNTSLSIECYELSVATISSDSIFVKMLEQFKGDKMAPFIKDLAATYIFNYYIDNSQNEDGVRFYVESRIKDEALVIGFKKKERIIAMLEDKTLSSMIPLELSIFGEMVGADAETIYFIYKKYLKQCGAFRASELDVDGDSKRHYFLKRVAVPKVLTLHVLRFKSVLQVMEERSAICSNLYDYYQEKDVNDEISSICRDIKIMELNNQVDESKIYVDVHSIKDNECEDARALYDMLDSATSQVAFQDIVIGELVTRLAGFGVKAGIVQYQKDGSYRFSTEPYEQVNYRKDITIQLFKTIRDKFLYNPKYGLDNYLSTRIRHGTLVNQLRNHFEEKQLVTNTNDGKYAINNFWINAQFCLRDAKSQECVKLFENFSSGIDGIITEIKDTYVQVRTEQNNVKENACFDYEEQYFHEAIDNLLIDTSIDSFDACFNKIIESLWNRTEVCLNAMREKLNEAQHKMLGLLHTLQRDVTNVVGLSNPKNGVFNDAISYCQNGIQTDFQVVSKWFKRSNYVDFDFTVGQVIETSIGFIQRNNKNLLNPKVVDKSVSILRGQFFGTLYDIFHDILNNALDYEKETHVNGKIEISVEDIDGWLKVQVSNPVRKEDEEKLIQKVDEINKNLAETIGTGKTRNDKNSGCSKIYNAVKYHLGSSKNSYSNTIFGGAFTVNIQIEIKPIMK